MPSVGAPWEKPGEVATTCSTRTFEMDKEAFYACPNEYLDRGTVP